MVHWPTVPPRSRSVAPCPWAESSFDHRQDQTRDMRGVVEDAVDCRSVLIRGLARDLTTGVAVATESWEVAARDFQADAVAGQEDVGRGPQVEAELVGRVRLEGLRICE